MNRSSSQEFNLCEIEEHPVATLESVFNFRMENCVGPPGSGPSFFDWTEIYPELQLLIDEYDTILEEAKTIHNVSLALSKHVHVSYFTCFIVAVDAVARGTLC
jgi:hypothetical protein